ncbi:MAG TPA: hypothetical protein VJ843_04900 [Candidatus Saccharimonadales bacterium]|nr:hypothetical protein [Candidatus Saccharimonadales bacterium]
MKELFKSKQDRLYVWLLGIIAVATHLKWLFEFKVFTSGDWWYISLARLIDFRHFSPIWVTDGMGSTSAVPPFYFIRFLEGLTTFVGGTFMITEKIFFFLPIVIGSTFGAYLFLRQYLKPPMAFLGTLLFAFNTAMIFNYAGALTIATAYALCPLALYLFMQYMARPKNVLLLIQNALIFSIIAAYEQRIVLLVFAMAFGLVIFNTAFGGFKYLQNRFWPIAKLLAIFVLLHAFWLIPYAVNAKSGVTFSDLLSRQLLVSFSSIQNSLTLYHPFWTGARPATFVVQHIPYFAWALPLVAFAGFLIPKNIREKVLDHTEYLYWALVALVGMFLVKQVNDPFPTVYPWLYGHLPGSAAFREASKFYLLIAIGYAVLVPRSIILLKAYYDERLAGQKNPWHKLVFAGPVAVMAFLLILNVWPLLTGSFKTLYTARQEPKDYQTFNTYIGTQKDFFRVLWVPTNSRWGDQSNIHPSVTVSQMAKGDWLTQLGADPDDALATLRDKSAGLFDKQTSDAALNSASIKYVVVPIRDTANEDDFFTKYGDDRQKYIDQLNDKPYLKKIDIGTRDLLVYENEDYNGYITASNSLQKVQSNIPSLDNVYAVTTGYVKQAFNVAVDSAKTTIKHATAAVSDPFQDISAKNVSTDGKLSTTITTDATAKVYAQPQQTVRYEIKNGTLTFYARNNGALTANGQQLLGPTGETVLATKTLDPQKNHALQIGKTTYMLATADATRSLGVVHNAIKLYEYTPTNAVQNPSFEQGLWQKDVQDCNNYDKKSVINMMIDTRVMNDGKASLQLDADKHTACTESNKIPVAAGNYILSFDYLATNTQTLGYQIVFNDPAHTVIKQDIQREHSYWQTYRSSFTVPAGATSFSIKLLGYPDYLGRYTGVTNYDNVRVNAVDNIATVAAPASAFTPVQLPASAKTTLTYVDQSVTQSKNLVSNGGFEQGAWQKKVGDCNNYDDNAKIKMSLGRGDQSKNSLQLSALTHAACTSQGNIPVSEMQTYLLSFDYQSSTSKFAYYRIEFNDDNHTEFDGSAPVKGTGWQTFSRQVQAPYGATKARVAFFSYESQYKTKWVNIGYDNVGLQQVPDSESQFVVASGAKQLQAPKDLTFDYQSATDKKVHVAGATTPFYVNMAESYNPLWTLKLASGATPKTAIDHYALDDYANGWYVDPQALCRAESSACHRNADGSYDLELTIGFAPQHWFYTGCWISGITLLACFLYLYCARDRHPTAHYEQTRRVLKYSSLIIKRRK